MRERERERERQRQRQRDVTKDMYYRICYENRSSAHRLYTMIYSYIEYNYVQAILCEKGVPESDGTKAEMNRDLLLHINVRVNPIPKQALVFTCLPYKSVKITLWEKEKLLVMSNYSFPPVFSPR